MTSLQALEAQHPEWRPWLGVVGVVAAELDSPRWDAGVGSASRTEGPVPLLAQAPIDPDALALHELWQSLRRAALRNEVPALLGWTGTRDGERAAMAVFRAALAMDDAALAMLAARAGVSAQAFAAVAALLPMPCLHACRRAWADAIARHWSEAYCPVCGAWPALAETCGIERDRYARCIRCGAAWRSLCLRCAYCGNADHQRLGSLLAADGKAAVSVETCSDCMGYIKVFNRLSPTPAGELLCADLASVQFDVAAAERGYRRPGGSGFAFTRGGPES